MQAGLFFKCQSLQVEQEEKLDGMSGERKWGSLEDVQYYWDGESEKEWWWRRRRWVL